VSLRDSGGEIHNVVGINTGNLAQVRNVWGNVHFHESRPRAVAFPFIVGRIPERAAMFQGRNLVGDDDSTAVWVLCGLGGVGKTQLAADYAHSVHEAGGADVVVWITASSRSDIVSAYSRLAAAVTGRDITDEEADPRLALEWLANTQRRWLIVFDDLQNPSDLRGLWPPRSPRGTAVVTTRRREAAFVGEHRRIVEVAPFTATESATYLAERLPGGEGPDARLLAGKLGHLPLALSQAAAYIADRPSFTFADYIARFDDRRRRLAELLPEIDELPDDHRLTVATTFAISIDFAVRLTSAGLARPVLLLASVLAPNGIPRSVFVSGPVLGFLRTATGRPLDTRAVDEALARLHRLSLITVNDDVVRVHTLLQRVARDSAQPGELATLVETAADAVLAVWPAPDQARDLAAMLRINVEVLRDSGLLRGASAYPLLFRMGESLGEAGLFQQAVGHFAHVHDDLARQRGPHDPLTLTAGHLLACWRGEAGNVLAAVADLEAVLQARVSVLGPDDTATLDTRSALAGWRADSGDVAGSLHAYEALLADRIRLQGTQHPDTLDTRRDLACRLGDAGSPEVAVARLRDLIEDRIRLLGPNHRRVLLDRRDLADWLGRSGDWPGAITEAAALVRDQANALGPDHIDTLRTRHDLACWHGEGGAAKTAVRLLGQLVGDFSRMLGPDHHLTLAVRNDLAGWHGAAGMPRRAVRQYRALLADRVRLLGLEHPDTLITRRDLACWTGESGHRTQAVKALRALLSDRTRILGVHHPQTRLTSTDLARWSTTGLPKKSLCIKKVGDVLRLMGLYPLVNRLRRRGRPARTGTSSL
jgi:hypothetical protein